MRACARASPRPRVSRLAGNRQKMSKILSISVPCAIDWLIDEDGNCTCLCVGGSRRGVGEGEGLGHRPTYLSTAEASCMGTSVHLVAATHN